jgi:O-antigen ligase
MKTLRPARPGSEALIVSATALAVAVGGYAAGANPSPLSLLALAAAAAIPYLALVAYELRRVLLAMVIADLMLQWDINFGYQAFAERFGAEAGLNISLTTFAVAGLYGLWAVQRSEPRSDAPPTWFAPALQPAVYIAICALSILVASDRALSEYYVVLLLQTLLLFIYLASTVRDHSDVLFVMTGLMCALVLEGLVILGVNATGTTFDAMGLNTTAWGPDSATGATYRAGGTLGSPNTAGSVLALLLPSALVFATLPVGRYRRALAFAALVVGVPALMLTGSRGAWIAFLVGGLLVGAWAVRVNAVAPRAALAAGAVVVLVALPVGGMVTQRLTSDDRGSSASRISMARLAIEIIRDRPILGVGVNNVGVNIPRYAGPEFTRQFIFTIHNKYLLVASEAGIPALLAFLWFLGATVARGSRCLAARDLLVSGVAAGLLAGLVGHILNMTVDIFASRAQVQALWFVAGLLAALAAMTAQERTREART